MRLTCEALRLKLMQAHLATTGKAATKRTSWSDFSSTRQATYKDRLVSPRGQEVPNRPSPTPRTVRTMRIRTRPPVATRLPHRTWPSARPHPTVPAKRRRTASATRQHARTLLLHAALGESIRDLNDQQSLELGEPSTAPQRG